MADPFLQICSSPSVFILKLLIILVSSGSFSDVMTIEKLHFS